MRIISCMVSSYLMMLDRAHFLSWNGCRIWALIIVSSLSYSNYFLFPHLISPVLLLCLLKYVIHRLFLLNCLIVVSEALRFEWTISHAW